MSDSEPLARAARAIVRYRRRAGVDAPAGAAPETGRFPVRKTIAVAAIAAAALLPWVVRGQGRRKGRSTRSRTGDLKWKDAGPDAPGVQIAAVAGDPMKGAGKFFVKLPSGFSAALHHHTADHYVGGGVGDDGPERRTART